MEPYKIVVARAANNWDYEEIGTATDSDIAALMVEGLINGYARKIDIALRYNATTYGIAGGVIAGIELYDYKTDEVQAVVGYIDNDEYEEDENTCAVCLGDYASSETRWIDGLRPKDSERVISGYVCDDCEKAGER
jgi:hypothetical protein